MSYRILISVAKVPEFESQFEAKITFQIAKWQGTSEVPCHFAIWKVIWGLGFCHI